MSYPQVSTPIHLELQVGKSLRVSALLEDVAFTRRLIPTRISKGYKRGTDEITSKLFRQGLHSNVIHDVPISLPLVFRRD